VRALKALWLAQALLYGIPWMAAVPVYLAGGVVITSAGQGHLGFWGALGVAVGACTVVKTIAVVALHQLCGAVRVCMHALDCNGALNKRAVAWQVWMKHADARKSFELTSVRMRAMEMILSRPGYDSAKVRAAACCSVSALLHGMRSDARIITQLSMLVAGPDWLTSVLAGMLGTNVLHVLTAQIAPTVLLIIGPATASGAFLMRVQEGNPWLAMSSLLLFFAAGVQARHSTVQRMAHGADGIPCATAHAGRGHCALLLSHRRHFQEARSGAEGSCPCNATQHALCVACSQQAAPHARAGQA
jgi:hypothetical protein